MRVAQRVSKGINWCTYSSPQLPLKKNGSNTTPKLHLLVFSDQSKGQLTESQGPTKCLLILKYWSEHTLLLLNTQQQYLALRQRLPGEDIQMLYKSIIFLSPGIKSLHRQAWKCVYKESNSTWAEEAAVGPPGHKSLVPECPLTLFSKTVCNLKDNFLEVCFVNQLKQSPLRSKLHTNVPRTLFCGFSWMRCYVHSHHCLKHGNTGVHISTQDCDWLLLSRVKELFSPSFLSFSNLKENIYDSLWGQYLWENCVASVLFLIMYSS